MKLSKGLKGYPPGPFCPMRPFYNPYQFKLIQFLAFEIFLCDGERMHLIVFRCDYINKNRNS